jgi:hypothetical protein
MGYKRPWSPLRSRRPDALLAAYKREARYEHTWPNGEQETLEAIFMRKEL